MVYDLPYEIIRIEKCWTPYGDNIKVKLSGNEEISTVSLPIRFAEVYWKDLINILNRHAKDLIMARTQGTKFYVYYFDFRGDV